MKPSTTIQKILVVDDDQSLVRVVRAYLEKSGFQVLIAYNGETALHTMRRNRPDLVVLDLMLPDRDGWDITRLVRTDSKLTNTPIIMLTARTDDTDKIVGLELGADDYITKPFNPREVVARVRSVLRRSQRGEASNRPKILRLGDLVMDLNQRVVLKDGQPVNLTFTEFNLLKTMMENPSYVITRSELIEQSMGYEYEGSERTLATHVRNLRHKIEPDPDKTSCLQTVYGVGYRLEEPLRSG